MNGGRPGAPAAAGGETHQTGDRGLSIAPSAERQLRHMLTMRDLRTRFFDADLFSDPAWDILLALYQSELAQQRISVSSCCDCAGVAMTTGLRHIASLCERGLVVRTADPFDKRRFHLSLSLSGSNAMRSLLEEQEKLAA